VGWEVLSLIAAVIIGAVAGWQPDPIAFWKAPWIVVALGWFAAAALVRLARLLPAVPTNIQETAPVQKMVLTNKCSMMHTIALLTVVLLAMLYFTTFIQFYAPLERGSPDGATIEAWFSRVAGFFIAYLLARTAILVSWDWRFINVQADLLLRSVQGQAGPQTDQDMNGEQP
jgi:hypothetical protein